MEIASISFKQNIPNYEPTNEIPYFSWGVGKLGFPATPKLL